MTDYTIDVGDGQLDDGSDKPSSPTPDDYRKAFAMLAKFAEKPELRIALTMLRACGYAPHSADGTIEGPKHP